MTRGWALISPIFATALTLLAACGGDATGPTQANVGGVWSLSLTNLSGSGISCSTSGTTMTLSQTGTTFSGSYGGGSITCFGSGESFSSPFGSGSVVNGVVSGYNVSFDLDSPDFALTGTESGASMSGTCTLRADLGAPYGVITLSGNWGAARQS